MVFTISLALLSVVIISLDNEDSKLTFSYLPAQENVRLEQARQPHAEQLSQHQLSQYQLQESSTPPSFWSMESHIAYNNAELKQQKALHQRLLKKSQNQAEQLKQFIAENNALQEQLRKREQMIQEQNAHLEATRQQYQALQVELSEAQKMQKDEDLLMAQNKEMKFKIDSQPDIIKRPKHNEDSSPDKIQQKKETYNPLSGSVQFGYSYEQDNNVNRSLDGRLIVDYEIRDKYKIHNDLYFEFEDEDGKTKTSKQRWQLQGDYHLAPEDFIYSRSDMQHGRFSSYKREDVYAVGYGRKILHSDKHTLNAEFGPGYKIAQPNEGEDEITINEAIIRAYYFYSFVFSDALQFSAEGAVQTGRKSSTYNSVVKAQNRIYQELYLVFDLDYTYTTTVPEDTKNREVTSGLKLLYAF